MTKRKKITIRALSLLMTLCLCATFLFKGDVPVKASDAKTNSLISKVNGDIYNDLGSYFDDANVSRLPETVSADQDISVIVEMSTRNAVDAYTESGSTKTIGEFLGDGDASTVISSSERERVSLIRMLDASGIKYTLGESYNNVVSGFEITVKAADFEKVESLLNSRNAKAIVGDVYESMESQVITNNPYIDEDTGIFKNPLAGDGIDGRGVVVAVLDTGLDYTHSAFSDENYPEFDETIFKTMNDVGKKLGSKNFSASQTTKGLTAADVWVNRKVPYAYDYADKDADVLPINSEHGTHVAGIIAGDDDVITGVAPNAQLAIMKVFSDMTSGAKTSWLIAALEDCMNLDVDVINMSLGSSCGFSTQDDKKNIEDIYSRVKQAGISLIAAASNDYNATMGSTKNGNNGLTSNPDSGTVGSPSTYDAALSVASVDGVKTSYLLYQNEIIYFTEASTSNAEKKKDFVSEFLAGVGKPEGGEFEYVTIPGVGQASDYPDESLAGKIALVKRGTNTFEEKVRVALKDKGAAGIIIYNNVSGDISMSVGDDIGAVCSVSQEEGEMLAKAGRGKISIYPSQKAGPFMSAFSSWGPTSDLRIKPEITAHGGEIYSAVPGGGYDRLSGTSMAAPNQAGATALVRQYVKFSDDLNALAANGKELTAQEVTAIVNQLMMSTTDILLNKNGLAYAVRKQGAGLMSILKSTTTKAYIVTYQNGAEMDKSKLEIGDDKEKLGVYKMTFGIRNFGSSTLSYNVGSIALTEGVNNIFTGHGDTTVTMNGYQFDASLTVDSVKNGKASGNVVTVNGKQTAEVTVTLRLSDDDKKYLNDSFKHGMYVEGFLTLDNQAANSVDLNVPFLGFYGDWTEAPVFDEEYYDTNKDELNGAIDDNDKLMADAYATRVTGGLYSDYIATMGAYYFKQNPKDTKIPANKEHIAISNQVAKDNNSNYTISSIRSVTAGLLRNAKTIYVTATEDVTGKEIFRKEIKNQRKSYSGGGNIYGSSIDIEFSALEHELKNNTKYWFRVEAYIDYGENENQNNARNVFEFPVYVDFEAPAVTGVEFRTEYDKTTKKTSLYADLSVYDNHYTMGLQVGEIVEGKPLSGYMFAMESFGNYMTPVYSSFNSTSKVTIELTDYIEQIKQAKGIYTSGGNTYAVNSNSFIVNCYDYAMNAATYEVRIPDEVMSVYFNESEIYLSPNQTQNIDELVDVYPAKTWKEVLDYKTVLYGYNDEGEFVDLGENNKYVDVVKGKIIAKESTPQTPDGKTERPYVEITATGKDLNGAEKTATIKVYVYSAGEAGYKKYGTPTVGKFNVTGYKTDYAFYTLDSEDREIGFTGSTSEFESGKTLSMYPSEQVTLNYEIEKYFDDLTSVTFESGNNKVVTIDPVTGKITAVAKGKTTVTAIVMTRDSADSTEWKKTFFRDSVVVTVKDPFKTQAIYLSAYKGAGETLEITYENNGTVLTETQDNVVVVPGNKGVTTINNYAFSGYRYVEKDTSKGDVIDEEDPYYIKQQYIGDRAIKKVILPHGVTTINEYAFAYLTALEEVVFPSTLKKIGMGAFQGCNNLKKVTFAEVDDKGVYRPCANNLQFINKDAFAMEKAGTKFNFDDDDDDDNVITLGESQLKEFDFDSVVAIGRNAFSYCTKLEYVYLPTTCQSISEGAFSYCTRLRSFSYSCDKLKLGTGTFVGCNNLVELEINADVIPANVCAGLTSLEKIVIGKDVKVINQQAFFGCTKLTQFEVDANNAYFKQNGNQVLTSDRDELVLVAPGAGGVITLPDSVTKIGVGAFSSNIKVNKVVGKNVTSVGNYAFYLSGVRNYELGTLETIGDYTFAGTSIRVMPDVTNNVTIGERAFAATDITEVNLGEYDGITIGEYAFFNCANLKTVTIGNNVTLGEGVFASLQGNTVLTSVTLGNGVIIGDYAFFANVGLKTVTLGNETIVGAYAFQHAAALAEIDLSKAIEIGDYAFAGSKNESASTAPQFTTADLSNVTKLGIGAFYNNEKLANVTLSDKLEAQIRSEFDPDDKNKVVAYTENALTAFAFAGCTALKQITIPETLEIIDDYAFYGSGLETLDLANVVSVGEYAFANTNLTTVNGEKLASIGNAAFMNCGQLEEFDLSRAETIGDKAFMATSLKEAELSSATTIGSFAFAETAITEVTFGENLAYLGDNPFYGCEIASFGVYRDVEKFEGVKEFNENITISANVFVENGVLYRITENGGYELVSYPMLKADRSYAVKDGTTRISARAFYNSQIVNVFMPYELKAIGNKAFYAANKLSCVTFTSLAAPNLEEEYDEAYAVSGNHPYPGKLGDENGLGIVRFYMWNLGSRLNNYYYGANFVDYVGKVGTGLTMVYPANGSNYDSFIYAQYFATKVSGESAPTAATLAVIELIDKLPKGLTLADEEQVKAARTAYNNLGLASQQALVTNYSKLTDAESTIEYLKYNQDSSSSVDSSSDNGNKTDITWVWIVIPCVCIICAAVVLYFTVFSKRKGNNKSETEEDFDEMMQEIDDDDETSDDDDNND